MAKRQRGGARPGQRAPLQRSGNPVAPAPASKPAPATRPSGGLSDDELARAALLEAQIVEEERAATNSLSRGRRRPGSTATPAGRPRTVGTLAAVADEEYRYVVGDLRKIAVVFAGIFGLLIASWLIIVVLGVGGL
jgi:hypothetical protein